AVALFIKYRDRIDGASEATSMLRQAGAKLAGILAQVTGWVINLVRWVVSLYDKFSFLRKIIQLLVTAFTTGFTTITIAVKYLIDELGAVATVIEGIFTLDWDKIKEGYKQGFKAIADAAVAQFNNIKRTVKETFSAPPAGTGASAVAAGATVGAVIGKAAADKPVEQTLPEIVVKPQKKQTYVSDADEKKAEADRKKREAEDRKHQAEEKRTLREQSKQLKAETEQRLADLTLSYSQGLMDYRSYLSDRKKLQLEGIRERMKLYKEGTAEYIALQNQEKMMLAHGDEEEQRMSLSMLDRTHQLRKAKIEAQYNDEKSEGYHNEWAINEALFEADIDYLEKKKKKYREGSLERMQIEWDIEDRSAQHQTELRTRFLEQAERLRQEYFQKSSKEREAEELKAVNDMYDAMKAAGMANEKERQDLLTAISVRYARERANKEVEISSKAQKAIDRAQQALGQRKEIGGDTMVSTGFNFASSLSEFISTREQLKTQYDQGIIDYQTYMEAMQAVNGQGWSNIRNAAASALNGVSSILGGVSAYAQACSDLEVARITANYDKQIQAAGNNANKRKKLEEKRDKEIKKAKNEANKKAMTIQIAQAIASTAANAISAYGAVLIPGVPWTVPLAVAAAAAATASGMLQVATIKKQAQAQQTGYYEGGFTGGKQYRKEAGVVHEGEFVANHQAVNNPNVLPMLQFLDQAQRNNTVGSLTAEDISRQLAQGSSAVVTPIVNVQNDNEELRQELEGLRETNQLLRKQLEEGIGILFPMDSFDRSYRHYQKLKKRP
ncbi:MAG: hypothetical protein IJ066_03835, partial [Bacteroidaceae bacterium]|nr:hypothetical protein [Bacteroidaceae bacterium]